MKMDEISTKMRLWVDAIASEKLEGLADQLEENLVGRASEKMNKVLFKLFMHLSHAAHKCDKSRIETGLEIWRIGCCVCTNMTDIPDSKKFFSCVYHTACCLLNMSLYREALEICDFILPGKLWKNELSDCGDMYTKVSQLLHSAARALVKRSKLATRKHYEILVMLIKYEIDITKLGYRSYWRYVLSKILSYCEMVGAIADKSADSAKEEFTNAMLTYISREKITLSDENAEHTYRSILLIITEMIVRNVNKEKIASVSHTLTRYFDAFRNCLANHRAYSVCFELYERLATALVRPIQNLTSSTIQEIASCAATLRKEESRTSRKDNALKWYSYSSVLLITEILGYWEESAKGNAVRYLTDGLIVTTMDYLQTQCGMFWVYETNMCRCSEPNKCCIRGDLYTSATLGLKFLSVLSRIFSNGSGTVNADMCNLAATVADRCYADISCLKNGECVQWSLLWPICGAHMYNISIASESKYYEQSVELYTSLCLHLIDLEGPKALANAPTLFNLRNPLCSLLNRLTSVHISNGKCEEAMLVCSLNGLISSKILRNNAEASNGKAFTTWTNIKCKYPPSHEITMLECLRANEDEARKIIVIPWEDYDLVELCLLEIKSLAYGRVNLSTSIIAALEEMERLKASPASYALGVQLLGYHLLHFQCQQQSIAKRLRKAAISYEREPLPGTALHWRYGHVKFYEFYERLREISNKTVHEMASAKIALKAPSTSSNYGDTGTTENIVPAYSTININIIEDIATCLERALHTWRDAINANANYKSILKDWEVAHNLEVLIVAGEYARLYHFENLEIEAWKLAHRLAREANDHRAIILVTTRSLSSKRVNRRWIEEADRSVTIVEKSDDPKMRETITRYRLSLADFYYQNDCPDLAGKLFARANMIDTEDLTSQEPNILLSAHLKLNRRSLMVESDDQSVYSRIVVQSLYAMLALDDMTEVPILSDKWKQLYSYDLLFEFTNSMALRTNSLLCYREISAHLMRRLGATQKLGAALRVAECLKSLCYIDLSRCKLDDCEVKLQGLEHILDIEGFDLTMKSQQPIPAANDRVFTSNNSSSRLLVEAVRDIGRNDTSPVLRDKVFAKPAFILHGEICSCFKCDNSRYQNLVFAATHLRAQLFALRRNTAVAFQHFEGALTIKRNILSRAAAFGNQRDNNWLKNGKNNSTTLRSYRQLDIVEYVVFHLDYCRFLKWSMPQCINDGIEIALNALELCHKYNLENHPVYVSTNQLLFQYRYETAYDKIQFSKFTVPSVDEMDVARYIDEPAEDPLICVTPAREILPQKAISVRRKKAQPFLKLEKVPIDLTDVEPPISVSPPASTRRIRRRNIADAQRDLNDVDLTSERKKTIVPRLKLLTPDDDDDDDDSTESFVIPKRTGRNIDNAASAQRIDKMFVDEIESKPMIINSQTERERPTRTSSRCKSTSQRLSASSQSSNSSNSGCTSRSVSSCSISNSITSGIAGSSAVPAIKIDEVTDLLGELTVTKTRSSSALACARSANSARNSRRNNENVITVPYDDASASGNELALENKRTSTRLRKKSIQDSSSNELKNKCRNIGQSASGSEDEVLIIETRTRRRAAASSSTEQTATAKESVKPSRSRGASKRNT